MRPGTARPIISSCPTCTGTTSWAFPSSRRRSIRTRRSASMPRHPDAEAGASPAAGRNQLSRAVRLAPRRHPVRPADARRAATRSTASGSRPSCSIIPTAATAIASPMATGGPSSTAPTASTSSTKMEDEAAFIDFFREADLVICDTMYSLADSVSMKEDWGHSSNLVAVDLCHEAQAKCLALFHHEPTYEDEDIQRMHEESIRYEELTRDGPPLEVICAYDGLEVRRLSRRRPARRVVLTWLAMTLARRPAQPRRLASACDAACSTAGRRRARATCRRPTCASCMIDDQSIEVGRPLAVAALLSCPADRRAGRARAPRSSPSTSCFPEHDRVRPETFVSLYPELSAGAAAEVKALEPMDELFGKVIGTAPVVLAHAGVDEAPAEPAAAGRRADHAASCRRRSTAGRPSSPPFPSLTMSRSGMGWSTAGPTATASSAACRW